MYALERSDYFETNHPTMTISFDRRNLLKALIAIPCAIGGYFVYREFKEDDSIIRTIGERTLPPPKPLPQPNADSSYQFIAVGDTGLASENRKAVIDKMAGQQETKPLDSIFLVGDNFYDKGVASTTDKHWQRHFIKPFANRFTSKFYACLGNHDYYGNIAAQVEYTQLHDQWNMPAPYYAFTQKIADQCTVEFFVLDTTPIEEGDHSTRAQITWLTDKLKHSTANYKIVIGHHPLYSGGEHGRSRRNYNQLAKLFDKFDIDLYICGHDHDLQLHDTQRGWLHLVSGSGSKLRTVSWVQTSLFAKAASGFAKIVLTPTNLGIEIHSTDELLFSHSQPARKKMLAKSV